MSDLPGWTSNPSRGRTLAFFRRSGGSASGAPGPAEDHPTASVRADELGSCEGSGPLAIGAEAGSEVLLQFVAKVLSGFSAEGVLLAHDVGARARCAERCDPIGGLRGVVGLLPHVPMVNALSRAVGAQLGSPGRQMIVAPGNPWARLQG